MTRFDAWLFHIANGLVSVTGLVYAWMSYVMTTDDPYALVNHPWQPHLLHAHIVAAPMLVFVIGHLWHRHSLKLYRAGMIQGRRSGLSMMTLAFPMIVSGYLIQAAVEPVWRTAWVWVHVIASVLWITGSLGHLVRHRLLREA